MVVVMMVVQSLLRNARATMQIPTLAWPASLFFKTTSMIVSKHDESNDSHDDDGDDVGDDDLHANTPLYSKY